MVAAGLDTDGEDADELVEEVVVFATVAFAAAWKAAKVFAPVAGALMANTMPASQWLMR